MLLDNDETCMNVAMESRLGPTGVVDPQTNNVYSSAGGSWLLAVRAGITPSIVLGSLAGSTEPELRITPLGGPGEFSGTWGISCDCKLDIGGAIVDFRPLYFGSGS